MPTSETKDGPTPSGGVRLEIIYLKDGVLCEKADATGAKMNEYDESGKVIVRHYLTIDPGAAGPTPDTSDSATPQE